MYKKYIKKPEELFEEVIIKTTLSSLYAKYNGIRFYTTLEILDVVKSLPNKEEIVKHLCELAAQMGRQSSATAAEAIKAQQGK